MAGVSAEVAVTRSPNLKAVRDEVVVVATLEELYEACRTAPLPDLVRVTLRGPHGDVRLEFGSFAGGPPQP